MVAMFETETIVLERRAQTFSDDDEDQNIQKERQGIGLWSAPNRQIAQRSTPARGEKQYKEEQADSEISDAEPPFDAVVTARFGRIAACDGICWNCGHPEL